MSKYRTKAEQMQVLEQMKEALKKPDAMCKIVCLDAGFREDSGARFFKAKTGMTPREFKEKYAKGSQA